MWKIASTDRVIFAKKKWDNVLENEKEKIHNEIHRIFGAENPFKNIKESIRLNVKQKEFSQSRKNNYMQIKWVAGWWKTTVLAHLAVNALLAHKSPVLVLCYNISLRNELRLKIKTAFRQKMNSRVGITEDEKEFLEIFRSNLIFDLFFHISHFHAFIHSVKVNWSISNIIEDDDSVDMQKNEIISQLEIIKKSHHNQYKTILIDEIQDFEQEWIKQIQEEFLDESYNELVVFGDEKQNIYNRQTKQTKNIDEEDHVFHDISPIWLWNDWKVLTKTYRTESSRLNYLTEKFREKFLLKYGKNPYISNVSLERDLFWEIIDKNEEFSFHYYYLEPKVTWNIPEIYEIFDKHNISNSLDTAILAPQIDVLREFEEYIVWKKSSDDIAFKTMTTFETEKVFREAITMKNGNIIIHPEQKAQIDILLERYRRTKKIHFHLNQWLSLATIHSFKGMELPTIFLIIQSNGKKVEKTIDEFIYVGLTRVIKNLIVINVGKKEYDDFFKNIFN